MYSVKHQDLIETVFSPQKLLYLCDAKLTDTASDISTCIGTILCSYPSASPNYMKEVAIVWGRYNKSKDSQPNMTLGEIRLQYASQVFNAMPSVFAPPAPLDHCKALVKLLERVATTTSFSRTGDLMVHKMILTMVSPERAAELSVRDTPFHLAGETFGSNANRIVRSLFERSIEEDFKTGQWEIEANVKKFIFFITILFETGEDLAAGLCCNHEIAFLEFRSTISFFCWQDRIGFVAQERVVYANLDYMYPIPSLVLSCLEMLAISGYNGTAAAESVLCAVKTPEKLNVRESLYRLVHVDDGGGGKTKDSAGKN